MGSLKAHASADDTGISSESLMSLLHASPTGSADATASSRVVFEQLMALVARDEMPDTSAFRKLVMCVLSVSEEVAKNAELYVCS